MNFLKTASKKAFAFAKRPLGVIVIALVLIVAIIVGNLIGAGNANAEYDVERPKRQTLTEEVSITGRIEPTERLDLALQSGGKIAIVHGTPGMHVRANQTLVSLASADLAAQLAAANASLDKETIRLRQLRAGADLSVAEASLASAQASVASSRSSLESQLRESHASVDSALGAYIDQFYDDPRGTPDFGITVSQGTTQYHITGQVSETSALQTNHKKAIAMLGEWNVALAGNDVERTTRIAEDTLRHTQAYLGNLAALVNELRPNDTTVQVLYDGLRADVAAARSNVNTAASSLSAEKQASVSSQSALTVAERQLEQSSVSDTNEVAMQQASVRSAQAQVDLIRAEMGKNIIVSPVAGVITEQNAKVGEIAPAGTVLVSVMADAAFEIEANVPEADIAKISVDDPARVTLDAYTGETFSARVVFVAPAETVTEGVATYKVTLQFDEEDERIKPGMTADLDIVTSSKEDALAVPQRAVITKNGKKIVRVLEGEEVVEKEVTTGIRGVDGMIDILSGLNGNEAVVVTRPTDEEK